MTISAVDTLKFYEKLAPSGIVYHKERKSLFVIGDQGDIEEVSLDGTSLALTIIGKIDFQGINL